MNNTKIPSKIIFYLTVCFFLSGMCGLIYQILWIRMLSLIFGHTTFAISTVITAFMGGLALGSYYFGRLADSENKIKTFLSRFGFSPLLLMYGILETLIGIYGLTIPYLLSLTEKLYLSFSEMPFYTISILRFILCIMVLIVPTFFMGGTLPLLIKFLVKTSHELKDKLSFIYFVNTIGAVFGTIITGFYLIPTVGLISIITIGATINIGIGILIYFLNKNSTAPLSQEIQKEPERIEKEEIRTEIKSGVIKLLFITFGLTGFASMVYELAWTRALTLSLGSSTYAFSTILATFLLGIAIGSILYRKFSKKMNFNINNFGWCELSICLSCMIILPLLGRIPLYVINTFSVVNNLSYNLILICNFIICLIVMIIPTTLMGFVFPLTGELYTRNIEKIGKSIGDIYAINTLGCILGSFMAGFVFIPFIGVQNSLKVAILINLFAAISFLYIYYKKPVIKISLITGTIMIITAVNYIPSWNPTIMSSGPALYADLYKDEFLKAKAIDEDYFNRYMSKYLVFQKDGISSTVSVYKFTDENTVVLRLDGKTDASTKIDMPTQLLLGYIPILHHPKPEDIFIVGLGSGVTAKAALDLPEVKSVECSEIEPAEIEANKFFIPFNDNVLENPKFKVNISDGRNALLASKKKYDIIISEPSNPWIAGIASLFTVEYYNICKDSLKSDGIMCQWLHLAKMNPKDVQMIIRTFYSVFPKGNIWRGKESDLLLLGSSNDILLDYSLLNKRFKDESLNKGLKSINITSPDLLFTHYITKSENIDLHTGILNTDNLPVLEFSAPKNIYIDTIGKNLSFIYENKNDLLPEMTGIDKCTLSVNYYIEMYNFYSDFVPERTNKILIEGCTLYPNDNSLKIAYVRRLIKSGQILQGEKILLNLLKVNPSTDVYIELAQLYQNQGMEEEAKMVYSKLHPQGK